MAPNVPKIARSEFAATYDLPDWRIVERTISAVFRSPTFSGAAAFAGRIAEVADAMDHHPDIELRYPGRVRVVLTTHASFGLTRLDAELAERISALASADGLQVESDRLSKFELAIDAMDIPLVAPFWRAVLGYIDERRSDSLVALLDPLRIGPAVWFQQMDEPRSQRNRVHVDVLVPHDVAEARIAATIAAGGRMVSDAGASAFWVLADPEGNEACICTWLDRD